MAVIYIFEDSAEPNLPKRIGFDAAVIAHYTLDEKGVIKLKIDKNLFEQPGIAAAADVALRILDKLLTKTVELERMTPEERDKRGKRDQP